MPPQSQPWPPQTPLVNHDTLSDSHQPLSWDLSQHSILEGPKSCQNWWASVPFLLQPTGIPLALRSWEVGGAARKLKRIFRKVRCKLGHVTSPRSVNHP